MLNRSYKKKIVRLTESRLRNLINETITQLLTEDQESKSIKAAKQLVIDRLNYPSDEEEAAYKYADDFVRNTIRKKFPILSHNSQVGKFILGLTRMYLDENLENQDAKRASICNALKYVASAAHINEYDRNLNGLSSQDLINRFAKNVETDMERDRNEVSSMQFEGGSDYDIVRIDSFEQAKQYGKYTDWCVTYRDDMFDSYTSNGINQFYFCLRNGFENTPKEEGENCPLDEYGLSMIAVLVNENGSLVHCTCRWNHENGGNDNIMTTKEISQVIGMNFYEVFKPNNKWKNAVNDAMQRLKNGEEPIRVFDMCGNFYKGYALVELNRKCNFIDTEGNLVSPDQWFDWCGVFKNGYASVKVNNKWNWIDTNGVPLYKKPVNQWFDWINNFQNGYASVECNDKWNWIDTEGNLLFDVPINQWFDICSNFTKGYARVRLNEKHNLIDTKGVPLYNVPVDQWFDDCGTFENDDYTWVKLNGKFNWITIDGNLFRGDFNSLDQWFDGCGNFYDGYAVVMLNDKWNFIDTKGNLMYDVPIDQWFGYCDNFHHGYAAVELKGKRYYIDTKGYLYDRISQKPLGINVNTMQTNESIRNRLTNIIVEKVMHRIQR